MRKIEAQMNPAANRGLGDPITAVRMAAKPT